MKMTKRLRNRLKKIIGKKDVKDCNEERKSTILLAGILAGFYFEGVRKMVKPADLSVGVLKDYLADKEKTIAAARKAGFDLLWGEDGAFFGDYQLHKIKDIGIGLLAFDGGTGNEKDLSKNIAAARKAGADFVLVYMKCTDKNATSTAYCIANAGADYIFGYGRKKIGPYDVLLTEDGRSVPVVLGCGNLVRNQGDAVLVELQLEKNQDGKVNVCKEGFYPCMTDGRITYLGKALKTEDMQARISCEEILFRIKYSMGAQGRMECYVEKEEGLAALLKGNRTPNQMAYEIQSPLTARKKQSFGTAETKGYQYDENSGCYYRTQDSAEREAVIVCTGHMEYGGQLEQDAASFGSYEFMKSFRKAANCFDGADFVIGGFTAMASAEYPSIGEVSLKTRKAGYCNCRIEFVETLQKVGFTGLAAANGYNACLGIDGIFDTERSIKENNMIPSGIGYQKAPVVDINGIKIGFVSATTSCIHSNTILTEEAASRFLNLFDAEKIKKEITDAKAKGAEFILTYLHCGMNKRLLSLEERKDAAQALAEAGADYIICTGGREVSQYYRYETQDGRQVPIATSLGCFLTGRKADAKLESAVLKIVIRRDFDGSLQVDDGYLPVQIFDHYDGVSHAIVPAKNSEVVTDALGNEIKESVKRIIAIGDEYTKSLTIQEIYEILGKTPSESDLERLGEKYCQPVSCISVIKRLMKENGVAVMYKGGHFDGRTQREWPIESCIEAGISLVIDNEYHPELPCIVVEESLMDVFETLIKSVRGWYNPVTVAITGSMGKTSAKELTTKVFESNFKTLCASGNNNAIFQVGNLLQSMEEDDEAFIQEVHGGTMGTAACVSRVISPDIAIVTNIVPNHISQVETMENLVEAKLGIVDGLKEDGVLILCDDNEYLSNVDLPVRTIRYSMMDSNAHYYAQNIKADEETISFEIVSRESEFDQAGRYPAKLYARGMHNVSNALAAFAAGRQAGIPPYKIIAGMSRYRTTGIRQNTIEHNGIKMVLDTYNSNPKALLAMFDVIDQMEPEDGGRKVLVLGMMGEQGEDSPQIHYDTGKAICEHPFDILFCYGEDAKYMAAAVKECGREAYYFEDRDIFNQMIAETVRPGDVLMVKGSHSIQLDTETLVPIFGKNIRQY